MYLRMMLPAQPHDLKRPTVVGMVGLCAAAAAEAEPTNHAAGTQRDKDTHLGAALAGVLVPPCADALGEPLVIELRVARFAFRVCLPIGCSSLFEVHS